MFNVTGLSHIALIVKDIEKMIYFYKKYASMEVIHKRVDEGINVAWLRLNEKKSLIIVMIEDEEMELSKYKTMNHFGFDADSVETVDKISFEAKKEGFLKHEAFDGGEILGYLCMLKDPDGNLVEFAYNQMRIES